VTRLRVFLWRLFGFLSGNKRDADLRTEIDAHIAEAAEEFERQSVPADEARRRAFAQFGGVTQTIEAHRERRRFRPFAGLGLDLRLSLRLLWRQRGFAVVSIAMIALGIAATTSIFSVVNGVVLKPLPLPGAEGLVRVMEVGALQSGATDVSNLTLTTWIESPATIEGIGTWSPEHSVELDGPNGATQVRYASVSPSLFPLLRAAPLIGRHFSEAQPVDDERRRPTEVILSYGFWQERFGGAPDVLGKTLDLEHWPRSTIIGVMPQGFEWPSSAARLWVPTPHLGPVVTYRPGKNGRTWTWFTVSEFNALARLKPGFTAEQAAAEATGRVNAPGGDFADARQRVFGGDGTVRIRVVPLLEWSLQDVQPALWMLLAAVGLLFAAAIGNVVNLQLARAAKRQQEVAVRTAIGAGGARLARQLFVETLPIAVIGGALGFAITAALLRLLPILLPANFPRVQEVALDGRVLGVAVGLTFLVSILTGLLPMRLSRRLKLTAVLADAGSAPTTVRARAAGARSRALIIASQVAVAALLLVGAALLGQSFLRMVAVDRGYELANVLTAHVLYNPLKATHGSFRPFYDRVLSHLPSMPGVTHAGITSRLPMMTDAGRSVEVSERTAPTRRLPALSRIVSLDYFDAMGMRVTRGRGFTRKDVYGSEQVMLVNETFAARYLSGKPLNVVLHAPFHSVGSEYGPDSLFRIVGVVADVKGQGPADPVEPEIYANYTQFGKLGEGPGESQFLAVRTTGNPAALARDLQQFVSSLSPWASLENVMTMEARVERTLARPRLYVTLVSGFAAFAVIVALMGLFGGLSYSVAQRTREIGVRSALGATPGNIMSLVLRQGGVMVIAGLAIGLGTATWASRFLAGFLFGVQPTDTGTLVGVGVGLTVVALFACAIPAWRASRIDPLEALRR
jgi:putative ABC transport system permease protein